MSIRWIALVTGMVGLVVTGAQALPDEIKAEYTTGSRPVAAAFSDSHRLGVVANADDNTLSLLDTAQAAGGLTSMAACTSPTAVEYADDAFVLACGGGLIERYSVSLGSFPASLSSLTDIQLTQTVDLIDLVISGDDAYPISDAGVVFHADLLTSAEDLDSYFPISLADDLVPGDDDDDDDSASTAAIAPVALAASADHLVVALDDGWLVDVTLGEETYTVAPVDTGALDLVDVVGAGPFYLLSSAGTVMSYEAGSYVVQTLAVASEGAGLALLTIEGVDVLTVAGGGQLTFLDPTTGASYGTVTVSAGTSVTAATGDGYLIAVDGTEDLLQVMTTNPWVRILDAQPDPVDLEGDVTLTLTSDVAGALSLLLGGDIDASGSDLGPDVTELDADTETEVTFSAAALSEGNSVIYAFVEDDAGALGRTAIQLSTGENYDIPAPQAFAVAGGNAKASLSWAPVEETGVTVSYYVLYFADANFDPDDGDPGYCEEGVEDLCSGYEVATTSTAMATIAGAADDDDDSAADDDDDTDTTDDDDDVVSTDTTVTVTLSPLTNGTTYYFAVAAVDSNGDTGAFTEVVAVMPQQTGGAAWLAGDPGGYGCDGCTVNRKPMGEFAALGLLLLLGLARRMKR